ncbi:hypothetical protein SAMN04489752_2409 [Brevibacterium siliguriense]|uniref:Uncharacterized protein n=1 Tax=Brevibacterium siliguriense TaxID=1136497 RepID=A0A1H1UQ09_9MICO|nr:hypothetical protein [Brevibacterium siliguriense]SDS74563.1 hypothetical protein SAMN04489752_2409 [Brevibacterium siliguriense]
MANIRRYETKNGLQWRVELRLPESGVKRSQTFDSEADAIIWMRIIEATDGDDNQATAKWVAARSKTPTVAVIVSEFVEYHSGGNRDTLALTSGTKPTVVKRSDFNGSKAEVSATFKSVPTGSVKIYKP